MSISTELFWIGESQAIRLPAGFELNAAKAHIERIGNALWIQPQPSANEDMAEWLGTFYSSTEPLPEEFLSGRSGTEL